MTTNIEIVVNPVDTPVDSSKTESTTGEENQPLRHVMAHFWHVRANGQEPLMSILCLLKITSIQSSSSHISISNPFFSQRYGLFDNYGVEPVITHP